MIELRFKPIPKESFPGKFQWMNDRFRVNYEKILDLLEYELGRLRAKSIAIEAGFTYAQLRNDGWPYTSEMPSHPGIILHFTGSEGPMRFPAATYRDWQSNLYAIALTLEALRAIDRYGVTVSHQQYVGFMLEAPKMNLEQAAKWFTGVSNLGASDGSTILHDKDLYVKAFRQTAAQVHPDKRNGDRSQWEILEIARELLDRHHGLK